MERSDNDPGFVDSQDNDQEKGRKHWLDNCLEHLDSITNGGLTPGERLQISEEFENRCSGGESPESIADFLKTSLAGAADRPLSTPVRLLEEEVASSADRDSKQTFDLGQLITDKKYPESDPEKYKALQSIGGLDHPGESNPGHFLIEIEQNMDLPGKVSTTPLLEDSSFSGDSDWTIVVEMPSRYFSSGEARSVKDLQWIVGEMQRLSPEDEKIPDIDFEKAIEKNKDKAAWTNRVIADRFITMMNLSGVNSFDVSDLERLDNGNWQVTFTANASTSHIRNAERLIRCLHARRFEVTKIQKDEVKSRFGWMSRGVSALLKRKG